MVIVPEKEVDFPDEHRRSSSNSEKKSNVDLESFRERDGELTIKHQHFHVLNDWTMDPPSVPVPVGDQVLGRPAAVFRRAIAFAGGSIAWGIAPICVVTRRYKRHWSLVEGNGSSWKIWYPEVIKRCLVTVNLGRNLMVSFLWAICLYLSMLLDVLGTMFHFHQKWNADSSPPVSQPRKRRLASEYGAYLQAQTAQSEVWMRPEHRCCCWVRRRWPQWTSESHAFLGWSLFDGGQHHCFISHGNSWLRNSCIPFLAIRLAANPFLQHYLPPPKLLDLVLQNIHFPADLAIKLGC